MESHKFLSTGFFAHCYNYLDNSPHIEVKDNFLYSHQIKYYAHIPNKVIQVNFTRTFCRVIDSGEYCCTPSGGEEVDRVDSSQSHFEILGWTSLS